MNITGTRMIYSTAWQGMTHVFVIRKLVLKNLRIYAGMNVYLNHPLSDAAVIPGIKLTQLITLQNLQSTHQYYCYKPILIAIVYLDNIVPFTLFIFYGLFLP